MKKHTITLLILFSALFISNAQNLVLNPGFETGSLSPEWNSWNNGIESKRNKVNSGSYSAFINPGEGSVVQTVNNLIPNAVYEARVFIKGTANFIVNDYDGPAPQLLVPASNTKWTEYAITFTLGVNNTSALLSVYKGAGVAEIAYVDDYQLTLISAPAPAPVADFSASSTTVTEGDAVTFTDLSTESPTSWSWSFAGGTPATSTAQNPTVTYNTAGTYEVTLTATNAEGSDIETKTAYITVNTPVATFVPDPNKIYYIECPAQGLKVAADGSSELAYTTAISATGADVEWKFVAVGSYWHIDRAAGGILPRIRTAGVTLADMHQTSSTGGWTQFEISSAGNGNYYISLPTATASGYSRLQVDNTGNVNMVDMNSVTDGSVQFVITEVTIPAAPIADFTASATIVTEGDAVTFTDLSTENPTSWSWSFAGGTPATSTAQNPTVTYNTAGTYEVTLTAANAGGSDVETKTAYITVNSTPSCDPSAITPYVLLSGVWENTATADVLVGEQVKFGPHPNTGGSWLWTLPDASTVAGRLLDINPVGLSDAGTYTAVHTNDCGAETSMDFTVTVNADANNLTSANQWVILPNTKASAVTAADVSELKVNGQPAVIGTNVRVKRYYNGAAIIPIIPGFSPITLYSGAGQTGNSATAEKYTIYKTTALPLGDNTISSFVLKKGYMATFAAEEDGTGRSKVYIAAEEDMAIDLPAGLAGDVSFLRVKEWSYVNKRGFDNATQEKLDALNVTWFYNWGIGSISSTDQEYLTMAARKGLSSDDKVNQIIAHEDVTTLLGFNEADDCNAQAGVNGFCVVDTAVAYFKKLSKAGLRLGSPSGTQTATARTDTWTSLFMEKAQDAGIRIDVVCVHWYDRDSWRDNKNPSPNVDFVLNRFINYLTNVHDMYGLPVIITEYNANPGRTHEVNKEFMAKSIEWLEQQDWIERYCWFQPNGLDPATGTYSPAIPGVADLFDETTGLITDVGTVWRDSISYPSIPFATLESTNLQEVTLSYSNALKSASFELDSDITNAESSINVFPNPASDMFTIKMDNIEKASVSIYNLQGQIVLNSIVETNEYTVDSNLFKSGIYLIKVIDNNNKLYTTKLSIQ